MKKFVALSIALALGGCASAPMQKMMRPQAHVAPTPMAMPAPAPTPVVVTPPSSPVTVTKLGKPRWYDEFKSGASKVRSHLHFHKKAADPAAPKGN